TSDGNGSHASTLKSPSYTKSVSWQHYPLWNKNNRAALIEFIKANQWSDGIRKRDNLPSLNKYILALTIDLAVFYKRKFYRKY
ncbi:TPA: hypothetical protein IB114_004673, partial [Escherichia coli]|nr:hypothetical protein [Escherichia coli]